MNTSGRYKIDSAQGDSLGGRVYDRAGAGYGVSGKFVGSQFCFTSKTRLEAATASSNPHHSRGTTVRSD